MTQDMISCRIYQVPSRPHSLRQESPTSTHDATTPVLALFEAECPADLLACCLSLASDAFGVDP